MRIYYSEAMVFRGEVAIIERMGMCMGKENLGEMLAASATYPLDICYVEEV